MSSTRIFPVYAIVSQGDERDAVFDKNVAEIETYKIPGQVTNLCAEASKAMKIAHKTENAPSWMEQIKITGGGNGECTAEFVVSEEHLNQGGGLHGGFTATIIDNITTYALMTKDKHPGVTVDLHVSYMKAAREGDEVIIDAKTVRAGNKLAYLECELRHKKDGSIIAKGSQTKFIDLQ